MILCWEYVFKINKPIATGTNKLAFGKFQFDFNTYNKTIITLKIVQKSYDAHTLS